MRAIIYTAIFGSYDELKQPVVQDIPCDFICFTDSAWPHRIGAWRIIHIKTIHGMHPRMQAKYFKLMSHQVFPRGRIAYYYDLPAFVRLCCTFPKMTVWIDGSLRIKSSSFARDMIGLVGNSGWAMFKHPARDCIFDDAMDSSSMQKYQGLPILEQVESYRRAGVPPHWGLYACTMIARKEPLRQQLKLVNARWWEENLKWSYQDQLSLPFVLRDLGVSADIIPGNLWNNKWFEYVAHNSEY